MSTHWLRYTSNRRTGVEIRFMGGRLCIGFRWSGRVHCGWSPSQHAPRGPFLHYTPSLLLLDANALSKEAKENITLAALALPCIGAIWAIGWLG